VRFEVYETGDGRAPYLDWFDGLDGTLRRAVQRRLRAIEFTDHFGNRKNLRGGLHELKFHQVIRIYFAEIDGQIVLLLCFWAVPVSGTKTVKSRRRAQD